MTRKEYKELLRKDYLRHSDNPSILNRIKVYLTKPGYVWCHWYRKLCYQRSHILLKPLSVITRLYYRHICIKYGYDIPSHVKEIGGGFLIAHFPNVSIHKDCIIGENVTIRQGCSIAVSNGKTPVIGNNVDIGISAIIMGDIKVGDNAVIGANSLVCHDVDKNTVVVGNPAKKIRNRRKNENI